MTLLLSLLGEQPIPNLIPLWHSTEFTATRFAATQTTLPVAQMLTEAIRKDPQLKHLKVEEPLILEAYDLGQARSRLVAALAEYQAQGIPVRLNLTGGTKLMSLAALQAAYGTGVPLLYVTTEQNQIIHYQSDGSETSREPIQVQISVAQYLSAHGLEVSDNQAFDPNGPRSQIAPPKEGDELEKKVERLARESDYFDDVRRGVYIRAVSGRTLVTNELDVVVTHNGRLAVCSCKSGQNLNNDDIYEVASLSRREAAGIYCGKVLVSALPEVPQALLDRAKASGVCLVYGKSVDMVANFIKTVV